MKAIAYSVRSFEKEPLALANHKKHDITLISNSLSLETVAYAEGKEAVIVFTSDDVSEAIINQLADKGVKYIATRSVETDHIDRPAAKKRGLKVAHIPADLYPEASLNTVAERTIKCLDLWQNNKCVGKSCACADSCSKATEEPLNNAKA
ncbi:MAG: lactate dehydrogenase [Sphingobacteriaceae bacterium]